MIPHGTLGGYTNHACRCERCRTTMVAYQRQWRRRGAEVPDHVHGTNNGYQNYRCRCEPCRVAHRKVAQEWRARRKAVTR